MRPMKDILWKGIIEELCPEMLLFIFANAAEVFDLERGFEYLDKELLELFPEQEQEGGTRLVDKLIKVFRKDGQEEWVLVHVEVQGQDSSNFAERMFTYFYRIFDRYKVKITAIAIFTGGKSQKTPSVYSYDFLGTKLSYEYNTFHIKDYSEAALLAMDNPFALVVLTAKKALLAGKIPEKELGEQRLTIAKALISSGKFSREKIVRFLIFLKEMVYIHNPEINDNFNAEIDVLTGKRQTMGILELIAEERAKDVAKEKDRVFVENLLSNTEFSTEKIASLVGVSTSFVEEVKENLSKK